jgi:hypothetical protein
VGVKVTVIEALPADSTVAVSPDIESTPGLLDVYVKVPGSPKLLGRSRKGESPKVFWIFSAEIVGTALSTVKIKSLSVELYVLVSAGVNLSMTKAVPVSTAVKRLPETEILEFADA